MANSKKTPWFPVDVKPVHDGVYETNRGFGLPFSAYRAGHWNGCWSSIERAAEHAGWFDRMGDEGAASGITQWRGLRSAPKETGAAQ